MIRRFLKFIFTKLYKIEITGLENYRKAGKPVVIVVNHLSFLDGILIALFLPKGPLFVINTLITKKWYCRILNLVTTIFPIDPINSMALRSVIRELKKNKSCVVFPEGRITTTGSLMKIYEGPAMMADKSNAKILPIRIDGAQYTPFSRLENKVRIRWFPKITLTVLKPQTIKIPKEITGRERRYIGGQKLYDIMSDMIFYSSNYHKTLFKSLLEQIQIHGRNHIIVEDYLREPLNYGQLLTRVFILGKKLSELAKEEYVGFLLPNVVNAIVTFFALQLYGKTPVMLNFSMGIKSILDTNIAAGVKTIITSQKFVDSSNLQEVIGAITKDKIKVIYLEDLAKTISIIDKSVGYINAIFAHEVVEKDPENPAVILFTSGSEGAPKAVVLSHANIQANRFQLESRIDFGPKDIVFNALPIFHSFGLTGGMLLPLLSGIKVFSYPTPLHYRVIPELLYDTGATIMFGTDTFLTGYARFAHPYDFFSLRYVFAGAEKLKEETRRLWTDKYGVCVFEVYGATETSPVLAANTPMHSKPGTVGRFLPDIQYEIKKVSGIKNGGRLIVSGPNVMKGYFLKENPQKLVPLKGKYDTGDIVSVDEEGYVSILGRAKRFAKIAGEMIPLISVEQYIYKLWPEWHHAILTVPDIKKGESLILVTENPKAKWEDIRAYTKEQGIGQLLLPKDIKFIDKMPLLGTGKTDYIALQKIINKE